MSITERLVLSIQGLQSSIEDVSSNLNSKGQLSPHLQERLFSYRKICAMQLRFTEEIAVGLCEGNYSEVVRLTNLINGLSAMILDDVRQIIASVSGQVQTPQCYN